MASSADLVTILLGLAAVVATVNHRFFHMPRAVALLLGSLGIAGLIWVIDPFTTTDLSGWVRSLLDAAPLPEVLLNLVLGLMLFAASLHVDLTELQRQKWVILGLATAAVIIATIVFGAGIWLLFQIAGTQVPLTWCMVLGALLAPTDAVVVDALLRRAPLPSALKVAISGESLFNDGAGVVMFNIMLGLAEGQHDLIGHGRVAMALAIGGIGGGLLGCATGVLASRMMRWADDLGLWLMISFTLVTGTYRIAGMIGVSGPTAVVACGLVLRAMAPREASRRLLIGEMTTFWSVAEDLLNAMLFMLIGFEVLAISFAREVLLPVLSALPLALLSRLCAVFLPLLVFRIDARRQWRGMVMLTWAGMHGGVSIALALTLPFNEYRGILLVVCYAVVVLSMLVQALTMPMVIRWLYRSGPEKPDSVVAVATNPVEPA
jgi:CPA1 family monovalent cation:H+ antiporter